MNYQRFFTSLLLTFSLLLISSGSSTTNAQTTTPQGLENTRSVTTPASPTQAAQPPLDRPVTPFDLSVSPPTAYLKINPGNNAVHTITLKNNGQAELVVTPELVSFSANGTTGHPTLSNTSEFPYLNQERTSFETLTLPPKATAQLTLHFSVPATAENREYPLTVLFHSQAANAPDAAVTPVSGKLGSNLIVLVSDESTLLNTLTVESFGKQYFVDSLSALEFSPVVKNNSYAAAVSSGSATLYNWRGQEVARYEIEPTVVLGYSTRRIEPFTAPDSVTDTEGIRLFSYDSPFLLGPYSYSVFLPSGDPAHPVTVEHKIIVWAVPFTVLLTVAITCFALGGYYFYKKRSSVF